MPGWFCDRDMSVFSPTSSDTDVAPGLIWQMGESMMSPLVTGWLIGCWNFDRNWWFHHFSSHQLHLLVNSFHRWLLIHKCQQHRNNSLTLQNEATTTTCEFNSRTVESAQNLLTSLDECFDASVHQPRDTQNWSLHVDNCEAHSQFFALTPEVYSPRNVVFQQLALQSRSSARDSVHSSVQRE